MMLKRSVDVCMTILLLCLMAFQVTGEAAHEWIGMLMTVFVLIHQVLNRRWYGSVFKGKYNVYRFLNTAVTALLLLAFVLTAFSGMAMSGYAVPFLYGMVKPSVARRMHLSLSYWSFVLMGMHLGLHIPVITARMKLSNGKKHALTIVFCCLAAAGLFFFLRNGIFDYMFFRLPFAFLDYEKSGIAVFSENILMLEFWAFTGARLATLSRKKVR